MVFFLIFHKAEEKFRVQCSGKYLASYLESVVNESSVSPVSY